MADLISEPFRPFVISHSLHIFMRYLVEKCIETTVNLYPIQLLVEIISLSPHYH